MSAAPTCSCAQARRGRLETRPAPFPPPLQIRLEQEARAEQIGQRKARRAVEQRLKELEEREFKRLLAEEQ